MVLRTSKRWFRVVLDAPDARDLAHFYARLLGSVGAEEASYHPQDKVRVMLDPAGHPFCLSLDPDDPA